MLVRFEGNDADKNKKMQEEKKTLATLQEALRQHLDKDKDKDEPRTRPDKKWGVKMLRDALKVAHDGGSVDDIAEKLGVKGGFPTSGLDGLEATVRLDQLRHPREVFDGENGWGLHANQDVRVRSFPFSTRVLTCFFLSSRIGAPAS